MQKSEEWFELALEVDAHTIDDVVMALEEATKQIRAGYLSGMNANDSAQYHFSITRESKEQP